VISSNEVCSTFTVMSSRTLLSALVYNRDGLICHDIYIYIYIYTKFHKDWSGMQKLMGAGYTYSLILFYFISIIKKVG
jgi:hypothetical protein